MSLTTQKYLDGHEVFEGERNTGFTILPEGKTKWIVETPYGTTITYQDTVQACIDWLQAGVFYEVDE